MSDIIQQTQASTLPQHFMLLVAVIMVGLVFMLIVAFWRT